MNRSLLFILLLGCEFARAGTLVWSNVGDEHLVLRPRHLSAAEGMDAQSPYTDDDFGRPASSAGRVELKPQALASAAAPQADSAESQADAPLLQLTLADAIELTFQHNPDLGAALAREEQASWFRRESEAYKYPSVDVVVDFGPEYNRPAAQTRDNEAITPGRSLTVRASQLLYDGKVSLNEEGRRRQVLTTTRLETRKLADELAVSTASAFARVLQAQQAFTAATEFVEEMRRIVERLRTLYDSGAASKLELDFAQSRQASARGQSGNTRAQFNDAIAELEFLTGELPPLEVVPPLDIANLKIPSLDHYVNLGRKQNTDILLAESAKKELRYKARSQLGKFQPIVSLNFRSGTVVDEGGNIDPRNITEVKLRAEMFVFDGGIRRSQLNRTKAEILELDWGYEQIELDVLRRVKQAYNQITTNRITLDATSDEIVFNTELQTLNQKNLELGQVSILELIDVEERLFNSKVRAYGIRSDMLSNYYQLMVGIGVLPFTTRDTYQQRDPYAIQRK